MRWILILCLTIVHFVGHSQIRIACVDDTTLVQKIIPIAGDTIFSLKDKTKPCEWLFYYDLKSQKKAAHFIRNENSWLDSSWYSNGQLSHIWTATSAVCTECMNILEWYPDGSKKRVRTCSVDSCITYDYYQSGKIKEINIERRDSGSAFFTWRHNAMYYENGQLIYDIADPSLRIQLRRKYYPSGKLCMETTIKDHTMCGSYKEWHENGQLKIQGQYLDVPNKTSHPKTGTWSYYNESGKLIKEEFYEEGKLVRTVEY